LSAADALVEPKKDWLQRVMNRPEKT